MQDYSTHDVFTPSDVGYSKGCGLHYGGMLYKDIVHFLRRNFGPTTIDELLQTTSDEQVTVSIKKPQVACPEPAISIRFTGCCGVILIAFNDTRTAYDDLPDSSGWQLCALSIHHRHLLPYRH